MAGILAFAQAVNQADKAVLGLAAEPIMHELNLTSGQFGLIAGSLYATFSLGGLAVALLLVPRITPRLLTTGMLIIWSLSQLPIVLFASIPVLIFSRLLLGAGEGGGTPTFLNMIHEWFDDHRRDLPGACVLFGGTLGALVAAPLVSHCIAQYGWRSGFLACSIAGLVVTALWLLIGRDGPHSPGLAAMRLGRESVSISSWRTLKRLLLLPEAISTMIVGFCAYWVVGFTVGWLPAYVRSAGGFSMQQSGWILSLIFLGQGVMILLTGGSVRMPFLAKSQGNDARWLVLSLCMFVSAASFAALVATPPGWGQVPLLILATGLPNGVFSLIAGVLARTVASERNRLLAVIMSMVTVSGMISPPVIGSIIQMTQPGGWTMGLLITASIVAVGGACAIGQLHRAHAVSRQLP